MLNNRIAITAPVFGKVDPEILEDWMCFAYHLGRRMPEYEFLIGIKSKTEQFRARNMIVEDAQKGNCDRILMLDDDMVIDINREGPKAYDFIKKLIEHDKDICGVLYYQRGGECHPVVMAPLNEKGYRFLRDDEIQYGLQQVAVAGGGCLLIKTKIFDRIAFPYFKPEFEHGTDVALCRKAAEKGFSVWADTSIELGHMRNEKTMITSRNRHLFQDEAAKRQGHVRNFIGEDVFTRLLEDAMEYTGKTPDEIFHSDDMWLLMKDSSGMSDVEWYRQFPMERACRQFWYNTQVTNKKKLTQYVLTLIPHNQPLRILDFGCGIGVTAFALAEKGHQVTAMDIRGTGTLEFLKWRVKKHGVPMEIIECEGGPPTLKDEYDVIVAMDSIEHIAEWQQTVAELGDHLRVGGWLFTNNGIMEDTTQPEHYDITCQEFINECMKARLFNKTDVMFEKRPVTVQKELEPEPVHQ